MDAIIALIHRWNLPQFLYNWQTLIVGVSAVLAAWRTIRATTQSADREVKASQAQTAVAQKQIETTLRLERLRVAREGFTFHAMFDAAMARVLAEAADAKTFSGTGPNLEARAYIARTRFSKNAFNELRGACLTQGSGLTEKFLELETRIADFASQAKDGKGDPNGLLFQLGAIEDKARHLHEEAVAGMERARVVIAETEAEAPAPAEPESRRSWARWWFGWRAAG